MIKITNKGQRLCQVKVFSVINAYPQEAGNSFPAILNALGSKSAGNIIPDNMVDGRKIRMDNIDVLAISFTAKPMMLATPNDTAIKIIRPQKCAPGFSGIFTLKAIGAIT